MASLLPPALTSPGGGIGSTLPRAAEHADCIYLDYQATTPVWPEVAAAAMPYLMHHWGNPSSAHAFGRPCATAVRDARAHVASLLNTKPDEILFLSCGSEADNHAIMGSLLLEERRRRASTAHLRGPRAAKAAHAAAPLPHVITSNIEHPAVELCLDALAADGRIEVTKVAVDGQGLLTPSHLVAALRRVAH